MMINILKKKIQLLSSESIQKDQLQINAENEFLALSCGAFSPKFLAKVKRCKADITRQV